MSRTRLGFAVLATIALALVVLGPAAARTPAKYGGTLVVGMNAGDPGNLDPTLGRGAVNEIFLAMCQRLYEYGAKLQLVPVLAAAVPVLSKDKLSYTIQLRQGIQFNDGTPFNAQAVVTTVQRNMTLPGSTALSKYADVDSVTQSGPYTVVYHLKARDSTFEGNPNVLSPAALDKLGDNFGANPVCVGPFMFDHRVAGDNITLIKSPYYYDKGNIYLDKIVYKPMLDATAAAAALKAGDIQAFDNVSTADLDGVRQTSSLRVIQAYNLGWTGILINIGNKNGVLNLPYTNMGTPLASSAKLRLAFEEAIDRNTLNKVVFDGLEQVSCTEIPPANTAWYDATKIPCTPYNPVDAKKLVAASGFPNPTVHLLLVGTTDNLRKAQFIQAQEAVVGIKVVIDATDIPTATARRISGNFDANLAGFVPGNVDPTGMIKLDTSGSSNYGGYSNPRLDLILSIGLKATSIKARSTLYRAAQQIIASDRPYIPLYNPIIFAGVSANVTGVQLDYRGVLNVANARFK
jgi:peptide/nickel transport system substrate-binding protein